MDMLQAFVVVLTLFTFLIRWHYVMASIKAHRIEVHLLQLYEDVRTRRLRAAIEGDGDGDGTVTTNMLNPRPNCKRDPDIFVDNEQIGQQPLINNQTFVKAIDIKHEKM